MEHEPIDQGDILLNCTEEEVVADLRHILFPDYEGLYTGPGSHTAREIQEALGLGNHENARGRARKAVLAGEMVEVRVLRTRVNGGKFLATGWVKTAVYDEWMSDTGQHDGT